MEINSFLSNIAAITSYAPWELKEEDLISLDKAMQKAEKLDKISPSFSIKAVKMIFDLKTLYSDILREKPQKDPSLAFLFRSLNLAIISLKNRDKNKVLALSNTAIREFSASKMETTSQNKSFVRKMKYVVHV